MSFGRRYNDLKVFYETLSSKITHDLGTSLSPNRHNHHGFFCHFYRHAMLIGLTLNDAIIDDCAINIKYA